MSLEIDPGSFRDPSSRVFHFEGEVFRGLSREGLRDWQSLEASGAFDELTASGQLIATSLEAKISAEQLRALDSRFVAALRHERIPFISYPYEWSFSMLRDAALLHLEVHKRLLEDDLTIKDGSAYNIQWMGTQPVFIDVGSIEPLRTGEAWPGYTQFCRLFLFPLLLAAYRGLPTGLLLRAHVDGPRPREVARLFSTRDRLRPGVLTHVHLQSKLDDRAASSSTDLRSALKDAGLSKRVLLSTLGKLEKLIAGLKAEPADSGWTSYHQSCPSYREPELQAKERFVEACLEKANADLVWDLGANTGAFSRMAARHCNYVVALEADLGCVEALYKQQTQAVQPEASGTDAAQRNRVLPIVVDLADPSPAMGWRGQERRRLEDRGRPGLTLSLALVHHLAITANIPLTEWLSWLHGLGPLHVVERVGPQDPMSLHLLRNQSARQTGLDEENFEAAVAPQFEVLDSETLSGTDRTLYFLRTK